MKSESPVNLLPEENQPNRFPRARWRDLTSSHAGTSTQPAAAGTTPATSAAGTTPGSAADSALARQQRADRYRPA